MKEHITTHLSGLPYPCDKCDYSFETQEQMEEHEVKHAEMEYEEQIEKEVTEEEMQKRAEEEDEKHFMSDEDEDDDDVAEFTITNDMENPEVVRRSKRAAKIKNYAEFLKEELGSDAEDAADDDPSEDVVIPSAKATPADSDILKPIIRTEGTKVYSRKPSVNRPKPLILNAAAHLKEAPPEQINEPQPIAGLEGLNLTNKAIQALGDKQYIDMKIGDKMVRVQKLVLTQAEVEAMAKEGRLEKKGNSLLLKKPIRVEKTSIKPVGMESIIDGTTKSGVSSKSPLKRTYERVKEVKDAMVEEGMESSSSSLAGTDQREELKEFC